MNRPTIARVGDTIKVTVYQFQGCTIRPHAHSRREMGLHWVTDTGGSRGFAKAWKIQCCIVAAAGFNPDEVTLPVSFPSMQAACAAIAKAAGAKAGAA